MNILVTGAWQGYQACKEELHKAGHETVLLQWEKDPLPVDPEWVEGIIGNGIFLSHPIEQFTNLKYIQLTSAGFDRVPMEYVKKQGIEIRNARGVYSIPMAEFAIAGVLSLYKKLEFFRGNQKLHKWEKHRGLLELFGKEVFIAGCGSVGTECAKRFKAMGCIVVGMDLFPREDQNYDFMIPLENNALENQIMSADIIILTLPLTEDTKGIIGKKQFELMKKTTIVVNIARGPVVIEKDLIEALNRQLIGGAVLDVFETEPLGEESLLWDQQNVVITPHNSFIGELNQERLSTIIIQGLEQIV